MKHDAVIQLLGGKPLLTRLRCLLWNDFALKFAVKLIIVQYYTFGETCTGGKKRVCHPSTTSAGMAKEDLDVPCSKAIEYNEYIGGTVRQ